MIKRRDFNKFLVLGGLGACLPLPLMAQPEALSSEELAPGIHLIRGAGSNVVVAVGPESAVVIDGGLREQSEALLEQVRALAGGKPISHLFNTNWRPEHCGLNYQLGGSDTKILAHENTRLWQGADFYVEWEDKFYQPMPEQARANASFYEGDSLQLGDETLDYGWLPRAHSDGDIYLHFRQADILVVSDLLGATGYPLMDYSTGGWINGMREATDKLLAMAGPDTRLVAAVGGVQGRDRLEAQAEMLNLAWEQVVMAFQNGRSLEEFKAAEPMAAVGEHWGDADVFLTQLYRGTWYQVPGRAVPNVI